MPIISEIFLGKGAFALATGTWGIRIEKGLRFTYAHGGFSKLITVKVTPIKVDSLVLHDTGCIKDDFVYLKAVIFPANATNQAFTVKSVSLSGTKSTSTYSL